MLPEIATRAKSRIRERGKRMKNQEYVEYVNSHVEEIAAYVDMCFERSKEFIREKLMREIYKYLSPIPEHFIWKSDNDPYDHSGVLEEDGLVSLDQTIMEFLQKEYTGSKEATYISGMGWRYNTYEDDLSYYTLEMASNIMTPAIRRCIERQFDVTFADDEFEKIHDSCRDFDEIYDNCIANEFFFGSLAVEFAGIGNIKLIELIRKLSTI